MDDEGALIVDDHTKEIVLDSDDDLGEVGGRNNSCLKIRKPQRAGYLWRNSQKVSRQSAFPPNTGACKILFSSTDNKVAQAENESMIGFGWQVINQNSREEQSKELINHKEEIGMKNVVTGLSTRDEPDCCTSLFTNSETTDSGKDIPLVTSVLEPVRLSYIDSQEPEEISLSEPLSFVDHYLSLNTSNFDSEEDPLRKSKQIVCPPILNTNGLQCLARSANNKRAEESKTFDWGWDAQLQKKGGSFSLKDGCQLGHERNKSVAATIDQDADGSNYPKCLDVCSNENISGHEMNVVSQGLTGANVKFQLAPGLNLNTNCAKEVVGHVNSPDVQLAKDENQYTGEDFATGVGLDTQVAAEAMEALLHAPPNVNVCYTQKAPPGLIDQSSEDAAISKITGNRTSTAAGQCINGKRYARKKYENNGGLSGECNQCKRTHPCSLAPKKKLKENRSPVCAILVDEKNQVHRTSFRNKAQQRKMSPENIHGHTSKSLRSNLHGLFEGNKSSSIIPKRRRSQLVQCSLHHLPCAAEQSKDTSDHGTEFKFSKKRRKTDDFITDVQGKCKRKENYSKLASHASLGDADSRRMNKLKCWSHPKKKRTPVSLLRRSDEPKHQNPSKVVYGRPKLSPTENHTENHNSVQRLAGNLIVYTRRMKFDSVNKDPWTIVKPDISEKSSYLHTSESLQEDGCNVTTNLGKEDCLEQTITSDKVINTVRKSESLKFDDECKMTSSEFNICSKGYERKSIQKQNSISPIIRELRLLGSNKSQPNFKPKESRRRSSSTSVSVLFSQNLCHKALRQLKKVLARLGFSEVSCCSAATHFIADKFVRTKNMLEAIAFGKLVVTPSWLESCGQAGYLIAEKNYILRDARKEKEFRFSMPVSLARASQRPLLLGQRVLITPNVKPNKDLIQTLVIAVHGQVVEDFELAETKYGTVFLDLLVLSCEEDYGNCKPFLERGVAIYSSELLLNGIIIQKLQYERYRILMNHVKTSQSTTRPGRKKEHGGLEDAEKSRHGKPGFKRS